MRTFTLALVLFNIGLAAWYWGFRSPEPPIQPPVYPPGVEVIQLVNEQSTEQPVDATDTETPAAAVITARPAEPEKTPEPIVSVPANPPDPAPEPKADAVSAAVLQTTCYQSTPIEKLALATAINNDLRENGYLAELQTVYAIPPKYLVYLPGHDTIAQARTVTNRLRKSGQRDYQILTINDQKNSISLGVYSSEATASIRQNEIKALGYNPIVEPAYGKIAGYRVNFQNNAEKSPSKQQLNSLFKASPKTTIEEIKCPG
jgi:hypothetical protein